MKTVDYQTELFDFYEQYAAALSLIVKDEEEKLQALLSNSLPRIERAISVAQANTKKMESLENQRQRLQELAGYAAMTFSEIITAAPEEEQQTLESLFLQIQHYVDDIKFHNTKSMRVARANMMQVNPEGGGSYADAPPYTLNQPARTGVSAAETMYRRAADQRRTGKTSMLETKI